MSGLSYSVKVIARKELKGDRSSRQGRDPAGASPAVPVARIRHVAIPVLWAGNDPEFGLVYMARPPKTLWGLAVGATWGRPGNAGPEDVRHPPAGGNPRNGRRNSGHLAVPGRPWTSSQDHRVLNSGTSFAGKPRLCGACSVSAGAFRTPWAGGEGKPRSEPDWGKPAVRDRREAWGNVAHGRPGNPARNRKGGAGHSGLKAHAPQIYPDR
jgi:hypothetical protein